MTQRGQTGMTEMSHPEGSRASTTACKHADRNVFAGVAPRLLEFATVPALLLCFLSGCILPLQFEDQVDAGTRDLNYAPVVVSATPSMYQRGVLPIREPFPVFTIEVEDKDVFDLTYAHIYRNYVFAPAGFISEDTNEGGQVKRTLSFETNNWCGGANDGDEFIFEVVVADQDFENVSEDPVFRALPETAGYSSAFWVLTCQDI